jgi:KDO2-lipid IV(A) lauroyltransferase
VSQEHSTKPLPLLRRLRFGTEYALFAVAKGTLLRSPEGTRLRAAELLGDMGYRLDRRHRRIALHNLHLALPELGNAERQAMARKSFRNLASAVTEMIHSARLDREALEARLEVHDWQFFEEAEAAERGVIVMSAHLGYWEGPGLLLALRGRPLSILHRPLDNPYMEREARRIRERFGNCSIPKRRGSRLLLKALRAKQCVGLALDQRVHPNEGKAYPFFGHPAYTTPLLATLSLLSGAPVAPVFTFPVDRGHRYRVCFRQPIFPEGQGPEATDRLTLRCLQVIEEEIRSHPGLWLWMHRRWRKNPTRRPKRRIQPTTADSPGVEEPTAPPAD